MIGSYFFHADLPKEAFMEELPRFFVQPESRMVFRLRIALFALKNLPKHGLVSLATFRGCP